MTRAGLDATDKDRRASKFILLVDDSRTVRQQVRFVLQPYGYSIMEASDGCEAMAVIRSKNIALVICDVNMPRMNGLQLLERLTLHNRTLPVLMLTVEGSVALVDRARRLGAKGWIIKPFKADLLVKAVHSLLDR